MTENESTIPANETPLQKFDREIQEMNLKRAQLIKQSSTSLSNSLRQLYKEFNKLDYDIKKEWLKGTEVISLLQPFQIKARPRKERVTNNPKPPLTKETLLDFIKTGGKGGQPQLVMNNHFNNYFAMVKIIKELEGSETIRSIRQGSRTIWFLK
jgi:hypothetical protein